MKIASTEKAKGLRRVGQLLSGSRLKALRAQPTKDAIRDQLGQAGAELSELVDVTGARAGAGALGTGAAAGGGVALHKRLKEKRATEEQLRSDARRAAGRAGMLHGGMAGAALGRLRGHDAAGTAVRSAVGALLGRAAGQASFNKRELTNDLHMERALIKAKRDRYDKANEKTAALELDDQTIDALYGL